MNLADIDKNLSAGRYFDAIMQIQPLLNELNESHESEWESQKADSLPREQELLTRLVHSLLSLDMGMQAAPHVIRLSQLQELDGKPDVAVKTLQQGIDHDPGNAQLMLHAGLFQQRQRRFEDARRCYERVLTLEPGHKAALTNLGNVFRDLKMPVQAEKVYKDALTIDPGLVECRNNYGIFLQDQHRYAESCQQLERVTKQSSEFAAGWLNLGTGLMQLQQYRRAELCFRKALQLDSDYSRARSNLGMCQLMQGQLAEGWKNYEARYQLDTQSSIKPPAFPVPQWQGEPLAGKKLLVWPEQGLGDQIMCAGWLKALKQSAGVSHLVLACANSLVSLFSRLEDVDTVVSIKDAMPLCDYWIGAMSVPFALNQLCSTDVAAQQTKIPPWLNADDCWLPDVLKKPRGSVQRPVRIGLCWKGSAAYQADALRSFTLDVYDPLLDVKGVELLTLLPGTRTEFLSWAGASAIDIGHEVDAHSPAFEETAAIMKHLDLVITSDTSIAHLAASLGTTVCVLLNFVGEWRWVAHPAARLPQINVLRQPVMGDWATVVHKITEKLRVKIGKK